METLVFALGGGLTGQVKIKTVDDYRFGIKTAVFY
jgi:hypothetical protein